MYVIVDIRISHSLYSDETYNSNQTKLFFLLLFHLQVDII